MSFGKSGPHVKQLDSGSKVIIYNLRTARIHTYVSPEDSFGDSTHIIESTNYLVIIDTQYLVKYSKDFRKYADSLNKTIAGVIITHSHPDHYFGLATAFSDVPSYALRSVINQIEKSGDMMILESRKELGDKVPDKFMVPTTILEEGEITVDGIKYNYTEYFDAEDKSQVVTELPDLKVVIVQDLVYNGYHPWLEKDINGWIKSLYDVSEKYKGDPIVLVGHGYPTSPKIYPVMKKYLSDANKIITHYKDDKDYKKKIEQALIERYPKYKGRQIIPMYLKYFP
jgi:glyoxylase-like metal-dependent hydrolase (beta-lactamase superfamily II)